ncbi:MAG: ADP-forming succinate--CoA ligase subunit beta [Gammaproteobacteria bacterium]|nr:ADP-forming succinate--CoA ligase subunit beta [Gammaproteobacteria bacterium]
MKLHEYQAKQLFADYGIPVPSNGVARSVKEVFECARKLGGDAWVIKAQVHAGGRGKAGGVKIVSGGQELAAEARRLLGSRLVTKQTDADGLPINTLLVEPTLDIKRELYLSMLVDRAQERVVIVASAAGGMDIEEVAASTPDKIVTLAIDPAAGLQGYQCRQLAFSLALERAQFTSFSQLLQNLYRLYEEQDASLVEINPLVVNGEGKLVALDAKVVIDDNALYRHDDLAAWRDTSQEDEAECKAQQFDLNYITLGGDIACMVNGAGLAMATMDLIKLNGGEPANFLDVGGGTTAERVAEAFKLILSDSKVKSILVNIFGGIVRCNLIAEGIISAVKEVGIELPVVVRLEGTNAEQGRALLQKSGLNIVALDSFPDAAKAAVEMAAEV